MKKIAVSLIAAIVAISLAAAAWLFAYHNRKSNDNLPSLASIAAMGESAANDILPGYRRVQLRQVWGKPSESTSDEDFWAVDNAAVFRVTYNDKEVAVVCGILSDAAAIS